ncbi:hypothetical protein A5N16_22880 [Arthrobacter sp. M6]|nr:hypothetical protein [Arthrobacter sp. M5]NKR18572.1 hypothetical protein [Arthrobacter sp. M6]
MDVGVQTLEDGAVRAVTVINEPQAQTRYDYEINMAVIMTVRVETRFCSLNRAHFTARRLINGSFV